MMVIKLKMCGTRSWIVAKLDLKSRLPIFDDAHHRALMIQIIKWGLKNDLYLSLLRLRSYHYPSHDEISFVSTGLLIRALALFQCMTNRVAECPEILKLQVRAQSNEQDLQGSE